MGTPIVSRLGSVPPEYIGAFLQTRGWRLESVSDEGTRWVLMDAEQGRYGSVLVPAARTTDTGWRQARLHVLLEELEELEHLGPEQLLAMLSGAGRDTVRIRVMAPEAESGELPLAYASALVSSVVGVVESAARAAHRPARRYQTGRVPAIVRDFMRTSRLGQTEAGSYVVSVYAPLPPEQLTLEPTDPLRVPFERQAVNTLAKALGAAHSLTDTAHPSEDDLLDAVDVGLTRNLMGALARLHTDDIRVTADVSVAWSPAYGGHAPFQCRFEPLRLARLDDLVRELDVEPEIEGYELDGVVDGVRHVATLEGAGRVTVSAVVNDRPRRVIVDVVEAEDYERLGTAHIKRRPVRLRGRLVPGGRRYITLEDAEILSS